MATHYLDKAGLTYLWSKIKALAGKYLPLAGGTMTGTISSSKTSGTYLAGNQGQAIIKSTAEAGAYTMLARLISTNGYFTHGVYQNKYLLQYTAKSTVDASTNSVTKSATLLDESGNSSFPGTVSAPKFSGTATKANTLALKVENKAVAASAWAASTDQSAAGFGFRAAIAITGVTSGMIPEVNFNVADAMSGNFSPVSASYAGGVYIYAAEKPTATVTIGSIVLK